MRTHRIGTLGGDGVGPELIEHGVRALGELSRRHHFAYELTDFPQSARHYRETGELLSAETIRRVGELEALFFGAVGDPSVPEGTMEQGLLIGLVNALGLSVGTRRVTLYSAALSPLKGVADGEIDIALVRSTTEDIVAAPGGLVHEGTAAEVAVSVLVYTRAVVEQVVREGLRLAQQRGGHVLVVSQSNTLTSHTLWNRTALAVGPEYPGVTIETAYPDTAASLIVTDPKSIDVIVTSAWLGGILSDLLTSVVGGKALMGSARVNTDTRFGLFEPAHGSAPKYTGRNRVSPVATLLALCMLLEHVGETAAAAELDAAIESALRSGRLPDITARGIVGTREATDIILDELTATERVART